MTTLRQDMRKLADDLRDETVFNRSHIDLTHARLIEIELDKPRTPIWLAQDWKWCPKCAGRWDATNQCAHCSFNAGGFV